MPKIINQQLTKKVIYYFSDPRVYGGTGEIMVGLPEEYAAPPGYQKIVCTSTAQSEMWSKRLRTWEETKEKLAQAFQRQQESEQVGKIRSQMRDNIANARNQVNRDFAIQALENFDKRYEDRFAWKREAFMHSEGYEQDDKSVKVPKVRLPHKQHARDIADFD